MNYTNLNTRNVPKEEPEKKGSGIALVAVIFIFVIAVGLLFIFREKIFSIFNPMSIVANVSGAQLKETDGRTNLLLLGSDARSKEEIKETRTDTILVASIGKVDKDVVLISIPRDLYLKWVDTAGQERYSKINAIYPDHNGEIITGGINTLEKTIEEVLGIPIHYYTLINFDLFRNVIDILGGINVTIDRSFTDRQYPVEGKENAPESERYETITFTGGKQNMNGDTALKYVRSRKGDSNEGTDFARAKRQQKVISAIKEKALSFNTLVNPIKLKGLYDTYANSVTTDVDFATIQSFYLLSQQIDFSRIVSIVLDDRSQAVEGGLLYAPEDTTLYEGQYVLIPQTGDYTQIHAYVQKYLFGDK